MSDETTPPDETTVTHAFAAGQEVVLSDPAGTRAKIVNQSVDEEGRPTYDVVYAVRVSVPESALSAEG